MPRRFLPVLEGSEARPFVDGSGRYELARAIAGKNNPLTARVWVNRVWGHLLGRGLVATPSDFGTRSAAPTHPELLDWLASSLMADGWSTKRLIRKIVLSRTYQQASSDRPEPRASDPANDLVWRMNRKRLELEPLRDAMLAASGLAGPHRGRSLGGPCRPAELPSPHALPGRQAREPGVALPRIRFRQPRPARPGQARDHRAPAVLFLLNGPFIAEQARAPGRRAEQRLPADDETWVRQAYRATLGRDPSGEEPGPGPGVPEGGIGPGGQRKRVPIHPPRPAPASSSPRCCCSATSSPSSIDPTIKVGNPDPNSLRSSRELA